MTVAELNQVAATAALVGSRVKQYRSIVMRIAYLSLDRTDLLESVRHMASQMKEPREGDWVRLKRVGEFLYLDTRAWLTSTTHRQRQRT
eukprot:4560347-Amphidinium_carterae.1